MNEESENQEAQDANNLLFQALQARKARELEEQQHFISSSRSLSESIIKKHQMAESDSSVTNAAGKYNNNNNYITINSGKDIRIRVTEKMHPLNPDECDVYKSLVEGAENSTMKAMVNHHINEKGEIDGFRYTCNTNCLANCLPITRKMFFRYSMIECLPSTKPSWLSFSYDNHSHRDETDTVDQLSDHENDTHGSPGAAGADKGEIRDMVGDLPFKELQTILENGRGEKHTYVTPYTRARRAMDELASQSGHDDNMSVRTSTAIGQETEDPIILNLLQRQAEVKANLLQIVQTLHKESLEAEASFECMPDNTDIMDASEDGCGSGSQQQPLMGSYMSRKSSDCKDWSPELPEMVGLFHAYVKGFNKDCRIHKLFILTSGGCNKMGDQYFNLSIDVRNHMSVRELMDAEETWYLKRANQRNNARILKRIADEFNLSIPVAPDPYSYNPSEIASTTTETMHYDFVQEAYNRMSFMSKCMNTTQCRNGILVGLHPSEGVWIFKGPVQTKSAMMCFGGSFGSEEAQTTFPICTSKVRPNYNWNSKTVPGSPMCQGRPCIVTAKDNASIVRVDANANVVDSPLSPEKYTYIDESFIRMLKEDAQWSPDNGLIELMPIAVVVQV